MVSLFTEQEVDMVDLPDLKKLSDSTLVLMLKMAIRGGRLDLAARIRAEIQRRGANN